MCDGCYIVVLYNNTSGWHSHIDLIHDPFCFCAAGRAGSRDLLPPSSSLFPFFLSTLDNIPTITSTALAFTCSLKHCAVLIEFIVKMPFVSAEIQSDVMTYKNKNAQRTKAAQCPYREDPSFVELVQLSDELKTRTPNCDRDCNSPSTRDPKAK